MSAGLLNIARTFWVLGVSGNVALGTVEILSNPDMAPVAILQILLGGLPPGRGAVAARGSAGEMGEMAKRRKGMSPKAFKGLGSAFQKNDALLSKIAAAKNVCRRK